LKKLTDEIKEWVSTEKERFLKMVGERRVSSKKWYFETKVEFYWKELWNKISILWEWYNTKLYDLLNKLLEKFPEKRVDFIIERLWKMEESVLKSNLDFPDIFIDNFKYGKYPMLKEIQYTMKNSYFQIWFC